MIRIVVAAMIWLGGSWAAHADMHVVASTTNMGMLATTIGGGTFEVTVLAPPDRDLHHIQVRPSMMAALRRADLVVAVGASVELGWLPPAIQGAANPRINPGQPGYFEAARQVTLIGAGQPADRSLGDVHTEGNAHVDYDPVRFSVVAEALAERLAQFAPEHAEMYRTNAAAFVAAIDARLPLWQQTAAGAPGIVLFHEDPNYLARRLGVPVLGYIEPLPGLPPTASHLNALVNGLRDQRGVILHTIYEPPQGPNFLAEALGWPVYSLPSKVPLDNMTVDAYLHVIDRWVEAMAAAGAS